MDKLRRLAKGAQGIAGTIERVEVVGVAEEGLTAIETLKSTLSDASLPKDMTLYRGTSTEALGSLKYLSPEDLVGKNYYRTRFYEHFS